MITKEACEKLFTYNPLIGLTRRSTGNLISTRDVKIESKYCASVRVALLMANGKLPNGRIVAVNGRISDMRLKNLLELPEGGLQATQASLHRFLHLDSDTGVFTVKEMYCSHLRVGDKVGCSHHSGYLITRADGKFTGLHRLVWIYIFGGIPEGVSIDHKDGVKHNNAVSNLRLATESENGYNRGPNRNNSSGYKGVSWAAARGKWLACIRSEGATKHLGLFPTPELASEAYEAFALAHYGEFYRPPA